MSTAEGPFRFAELLASSGDRASLPQIRHYRTRDGSSLPFRHYACEAETALILLHGSGADGTYLHPFALALSRQNIANVYTPDLRGHGTAPARRGDIDYIGQLEDDLADLVAQIRTETAVRKLIVGGHSSGGGLALRFGGGRYGHLGDGYLLLAPYLGHNAPTVKRNSGGWARPAIGRIVAIALLNALGIKAFNAAKVLRFNLPDGFRTGTETLAYSYRMMTGFNPVDYRTELRSIRSPMLIIVGSQDEAFYPERFEPTVHPHKPDAKIEVAEGVSHLSIVLHNRAATTTARWLDTL